ncbi:MAG: chemotaxis protein CheW [Victivallales bacterium]|nr:chemotaxis protein CheW [Victivallales bacterium]
MKNVVIFELEQQKYALPTESVEKIVNAVKITSLPHTPDKIQGIINVHGKVVAVIDIRKIMDLPTKTLELSDKIIITKTKKRQIAFVVDSVLELAEIKEDRIVKMEEVVSDPDIYDGTIKTSKGLIIVYNTAKFLSLEDEEALEKALSG